MLEDKKMMITDENGKETEVEILFTFEGENGKSYVLFHTLDNQEDVYAYSFNEEGNLIEIETEEEWNMCQEVLAAFEDEELIDE
ncbi:MAG: DUF1292 domain-containing protein [Solobacterium sp.]|nr:DUF1292 domain-containing protein [Solobacterium sp.]